MTIYLDFIWTLDIKDTHREKAPSNKTLTFEFNICVVGTLNLVFIRGSYNEIKFPKK